MEFLQYPLALIVTLGVLVTFHELGHYGVARWSGVRILRFSVGFGRPIWMRRDSRGTEFVVAAIPLGGYVRMLDEREPEHAVAAGPDDVSFNQLGVWWRMAIALGGPLANFLLAALVYWWLFVVGTTSIAPMLGEVPPDSPGATAGLVPNDEILAIDGVPTPTWQDVSMALGARLGDTGAIELSVQRPGSGAPRAAVISISDWHSGEDEPDLLASLGITPAVPAVLGQVLADTPGERAGLKVWDRVVAADGEPVAGWSDLVQQIQMAPDRPLTLTVERQGAERIVQVTPEARAAVDGSRSGYLGVGPHTNEVRHGAFAAIPKSLSETWSKSVLTVGLIKKMVTGQVSMKNLSGPITIAKVAGDSARSGWRFFLSVLALLSISLGVLNLLPIPILDGGHILFCAAEVVRGKPVSERVQIMGTQVGLVLVGGLMLLAIYNDIARLF